MSKPEPEDGDAVDFDLKLRVGAETLRAHGRVSSAPLRVADFLPVVQSISDAIGDVAARREAKAGHPVSCREGCGACCRQPVPVGEAEAIRLLELLEALPPERQARIRGRFASALRLLREHGLLEYLREIRHERDPQKRQEFALRYFRLRIPCPYLEEERCSIHADRPLACREYSVTSPAEDCRNPSPERIRMVKLPYKLSYILFRFGDGAGEDELRWMPLVLTLDWAEANRRDPPPAFPGKLLFENFVGRIAKGGAAS